MIYINGDIHIFVSEEPILEVPSVWEPILGTDSYGKEIMGEV